MMYIHNNISAHRHVFLGKIKYTTEDIVGSDSAASVTFYHIIAHSVQLSQISTNLIYLHIVNIAE